jgi:hypothetical protein
VNYKYIRQKLIFREINEKEKLNQEEELNIVEFTSRQTIWKCNVMCSLV